MRKKRPPNVGKKVIGINIVKGVWDKRNDVELLWRRKHDMFSNFFVQIYYVHSS